MVSRRKRSAKLLECLQAVLEALEVHLEMMAPVWGIAEGGTFEVHHNLLGGNRILATAAYNSHIFGLHRSWVVSLVSY
jgi:hypothetical protein